MCKTGVSYVPSLVFLFNCELIESAKWYLQQVTMSMIVSRVVKMRKNDPIIPKPRFRGSVESCDHAETK